jgi:hypothetical protein
MATYVQGRDALRAYALRDKSLEREALSRARDKAVG